MKRLSHILVADDRADTRDLLRQLLEDEYRVSTVADGAEAIALIERDRPDLLLLDLLMPGVDGFAVLEHLQAHPAPFLPVIVRSAVTEKEVRLRALELGAHEFLCLPIDEAELGVRIHTMLSLKRAMVAAGMRADVLEAAVVDRTLELRQAIEALRLSNHYKDEFLSVISHELRTPLGFIVASASLLEDGLVGELSPDQRGMVQKIAMGGDRMMELVGNLLDMSLIAAGKLDLHPHVESYEALVAQAVAALRPLAAEKHIAVETEVAVPESLLLDDRRTVQVLTNLVQNALKFTEPGGRVVIRAFVEAGELMTEVTDTGMGIRADDMHKLFHQFKQLDMSTTRVAGGSGLGLSLSKGIVEAQGGRIGARSVTGEGSTFWFALPTGAAR